ncbi:MAG: glycosyltransferase [Vampirovibrio sp.]|nr:glycosyltransferase [Vampirovibrio sp.]
MDYVIPPDLLYVPLLLCLALCLILTTFFTYSMAGIRAAVFLCLVTLGVRYEVWRLTETLNLDTPLTAFLSLLVFGAEVLLFTHFLGNSLFEIWRKDRTEETNEKEEFLQNGEYRPNVDVYITTYNEPADVLKRSIIGCKSMDYDNKQIYLLDDGNRPEIKTLADEYGIGYITRQNNTHYKAGNLNNAIQNTDGELLACFDADFIPTKNFLTRTLGYFIESDVALVQTPQNFYNSDPIENNLGLFGIITCEQELFFQKVQPSRDAANAVICCGTSYVIRRLALEDIGGFPTSSITEDFLTSIELHSRQYRVVYVNELLSAGDAPGNIGDYIKQRIRWCRGILQAIYSKTSPLTIAGLNVRQRLYHTLGIFYWLTAFSRVILLATPLCFLIFDIFPIRTSWAEIVYYFLPYYLSYVMLENWLSGGKRSPVWSDLYEYLICFPICTTVLSTFLKPFGTPFWVTPKMQGVDKVRFNMSVGYPLLVMFFVYILAFMLQLKGWDWQPEHEPTVINMIWGVYNIVILWLTLQICFDVPEKREDVTFMCQLPGQLTVAQEKLEIIVAELSLTGVLIQLPSLTAKKLTGKAKKFTLDIPSLELKKLKVSIPEDAQWDALQIASEAEHQTVTLAINDLTEKQYASLVQQLYCQPDTWQDRRLNNNVYFWNFILSIFRIYPLTSPAIKSSGAPQLKLA